MQAKNNQKVEPMTKIGDVVLSVDALEELKSMQKDDNESLNDTLNVLSNAVVFIARNIHNLYEDDLDEAMTIMEALGITAKYLKHLRKP